MYKVPKITGFTADQLAQRLEEALINEQASKEVKEKYSPTYRKVEMPLASEQEVTERVMASIDNDPRTRATTEEKWDIMKSEHEAKIKEDKRARVQASEIIENRIQNQLKSMGIDPNSYEYSVEYERISEGGDFD